MYQNALFELNVYLFFRTAKYHFKLWSIIVAGYVHIQMNYYGEMVSMKNAVHVCFDESIG